MPTLTFHDITLGQLEEVTVELDYGGLVQEGFGQATLLLKLSGELDEVTLDLGEVHEGGDEGSTLAAILRELADEVEQETRDYKDEPTQFDAFVLSDRDGWGVILEGTTVEVPRGLTEDGAIVALELACRDAGCFPPLWIDRLAGTSSSMPRPITAGAIRNAAVATLAGEGLEAVSCEHCGEDLELRSGVWTHDDDYYGHPGTYPVACERVDDEPATVATPELPFDRAGVEAILEGPEALGV